MIFSVEWHQGFLSEQDNPSYFDFNSLGIILGKLSKELLKSDVTKVDNQPLRARQL
ncbi:MAG: hypothetical protein CFH41_00384 [Alphaproteobacteria bacterium MarineAlpha11_Bin1]|nr:MAG: hypothetical protein CFH41_00384 [Alphaproteobacteria bacterium MarineAlpha11_Bin1]